MAGVVLHIAQCGAGVETGRERITNHVEWVSLTSAPSMTFSSLMLFDGQRDSRLPGALTEHAQDPVAGVGAEVGDIDGAGLVHPQRIVHQQPDHRRRPQRLRPRSASAAATRARTWSRSRPMVAV